MTLPIASVETPGSQENFAYISEKSLLPGLGDVRLRTGGGVPPGWMKADGREISRDGYRELFLEIGTTIGPGNETTTFNIPDLDGLEPLAQMTYIVRVK